MRSLARPGGNLTGFSADAGVEMHGKRLQLLKEAAPRARRLAYLGPANTLIEATRSVLDEAAAQLGVELAVHTMEGSYTEANFQATFARIAADRVDGIYVAPSNPFNTYGQLVVDLVAALGVPAIYACRVHPDAGGLMSYGSDLDEISRGAAGYVARIFNGEKPADLPIQLPTRFEMVVNIKTAKAQGIVIPESLLVFATEVIE